MSHFRHLTVVGRRQLWLFALHFCRLLISLNLALTIGWVEREWNAAHLFNLATVSKDANCCRTFSKKASFALTTGSSWMPCRTAHSLSSSGQVNSSIMLAKTWFDVAPSILQCSNVPPTPTHLSYNHHHHPQGGVGSHPHPPSQPPGGWRVVFFDTGVQCWPIINWIFLFFLNKIYI